MLGRLIREDVTVVLDLGPALAPVNADSGQVEQVIMNLAVNARDAMPKGGTLTIRTADVDVDERAAKIHLLPAPGSYVVLAVCDTGTGMTPAVKARLFEPFFTTKEHGKGTGLGLATVRGIASRCGGGVSVDSEVGRGTSITVYLPRAEAAEAAIAHAPPAMRARTHGQTILVVEDAAGLRADEGTEPARLRCCSRRAWSVRLFDDHPSIDLLLTDVVMPGASERAGQAARGTPRN